MHWVFSFSTVPFVTLPLNFWATVPSVLQKSVTSVPAAKLTLVATEAWGISVTSVFTFQIDNWLTST